MTTAALVVAALLVASLGLLRAQDELGKIDFPTSGSAAAQPAFLKGVLLMHSFEYDDAREAFLEAQKADPGFAMAYWGEAMTYNHPVWQQTAPDLAKAALARLAPTAEAARPRRRPRRRRTGWRRSRACTAPARNSLATAPTPSTCGACTRSIRPTTR